VKFGLKRLRSSIKASTISDYLNDDYAKFEWVKTRLVETSLKTVVSFKKKVLNQKWKII
jgi:hypothetical protein